MVLRLTRESTLGASALDAAADNWTSDLCGGLAHGDGHLRGEHACCRHDVGVKR